MKNKIVIDREALRDLCLRCYLRGGIHGMGKKSPTQARFKKFWASNTKYGLMHHMTLLLTVGDMEIPRFKKKKSS